MNEDLRRVARRFVDFVHASTQLPMLDLAEGARGAAGQVQRTLSEVQRSIAQLQPAIVRSAALAAGQSAALVEVRGVVEGLQRAVLELASESGAQRRGTSPRPASGVMASPSLTSAGRSPSA